MSTKEPFKIKKRLTTAEVRERTKNVPTMKFLRMKEEKYLMEISA